MKIAIFTEHFTPENDGIGDYTSLLVDELVKLKLLVDVITLAGEKEKHDNIKGVAVHRLGISQSQSYYREVIECLKIIKPDIVHLQVAISLGQNQKWVLSIILLPFLIKKYLVGTKIVLTFHQYPCQFIDKYLLKKSSPELFISLIKHLYSVIFNEICNWTMNKLADSIIIADSLYEKYIRRKSVVKYLKIPSNIPPLFLSEAERINLRKQYGIEKSQILLGYFGKIFQEKNFEAIIQLLVQITDSKLLYIGQMTGNKYLLEKITNMIIKFNLTERIVETGYLSTVDVAKCLNIVDVYVCLFASGVSPKNASFTAAVSQGIFVVTTSTEKQGYSDNENVFYLTPPGNVNVIMDAINTYGMKRIVPDCGLCPRWADIAEQHLQIYLQLAGAL